MTIRRLKESSAVRARDEQLFERLLGGPLTLGKALEGLRLGEDQSLAGFGRRIGLSAQKLCDLEKGRRHVSPERAAQIARKLGHPEAVFVRLALQDLVDAGGLRFKVQVEAA